MNRPPLSTPRLGRSAAIAVAGALILGALGALGGCAASRGSDWAQLTPAIPTDSASGVIDLGIRDGEPRSNRH